MHIPQRHFDQSDPFAIPKQMIHQLQQNPQLLNDLPRSMPSLNVRQPDSAGISTMGFHPAEPTYSASSDFDTGSSLPTVYFRPRRIPKQVPWQWALCVAMIRMGRKQQKLIKQQTRTVKKVVRKAARLYFPRRPIRRGLRR
ncbi:hypothetical protein ACH50O_14535 [Methylomonas sp. 2BW1-5-20]|uniref:hypothetical protein n=1 Tax=Methylomonas sp. 2BW1-5-20 TaxID=3376686 RepID=UPI0040522EF0